MTEVVLRSASSQRVLLSPVKTSPKGTEIRIFSSPSQVPRSLLETLKSSSLLALDFETNETDISLPSFKAVGVGVSDGKVSIYVNLLTCSPEEKKAFLLTLARLPLIGHNVYFDGGVFFRETGFHANWKFCTYGLTKQLSSEDQTKKAGLKTLQTELLGWEDSNEKELDQWLVDFGYHKENHFLSQRDGAYLKTGTSFYYKPDKSQMWRAPQRILGHYCCLDAYSTYLLFQRVLSPAMDRVDRLCLEEYHKKDFLTEVEILIENWIHGITLDKEKLNEHQKLLKRQIDEAKNSFLSNEVIAPLLQAFNTDILNDLERSKPPKFRKPPKLSQEPARLTKSGNLSRNWEKWNLRREELVLWSQNPANISKSYLNWEERKLALEKELEETGGFNLNSAHHLKWLVYDKLGFKPLVFTKSGQPGVGEDALTPLSPLFEDLVTYKTLTKELGYVDACLESSRQGKDGLWRIYPQYSVPGTLTGRLAGTGGVNVQQLPKSRGYLSCWKPMEEGKIWVDFDVTALEPVVLTELSRDKGMMAVYGPGTQFQDIYLYFGSSIPGIGKQIVEAGYSPDFPTKDGTSQAKKLCKSLRSICKTVVLAKNYGAGAKKIHHTLTLNGSSLSLDEVKLISQSYNNTFRGVKEFEARLKREWEENRGWILNGLGLPVAVSEDYLKDLVNRVCQSTGHGILMKALRIFKQVMRENKIQFTWVIPDFHDQFIVSCDKSVAPQIKDLISGEVLDRLNKELGGLIPIKGDPQVVENLAQAKLED